MTKNKTDKATETANTKGNAPVKIFRARGVKVSVFENETRDESRKFYKASLQRVYKDGDEFKTTTGLGLQDMPVACHLLQQAWAWMMEAEATRSDADEQGRPETSAI